MIRFVVATEEHMEIVASLKVTSGAAMHRFDWLTKENVKVS